MAIKNPVKTIFYSIVEVLDIAIAMSGFVFRHATISRVLVMLLSVAFTAYITLYQASNVTLAIIYFIVAELLYMGFIYSVLSQHGLRLWFIKKWGEKKGFLVYEAILGFIFYHLGCSIGNMALATTGTLFDFVWRPFLMGIVIVLGILGFFVKVWATKVTSVDIYYWKDMFLGRKISTFVVSGPYRYFKSPMYGIGHLHAYAIAIGAGSIVGLAVAVFNQGLIFLFLQLVEKDFIRRIHSN